MRTGRAHRYRFAVFFVVFFAVFFALFFAAASFCRGDVRSFGGRHFVFV